ncbi:6966_t:CDS:2, partial [Funneliformis caledonium]
MGRLKRRTQQCSDDGISIDDEVGWTDEDEAEQLFLVLTKNMKALKHSKCPLVN